METNNDTIVSVDHVTKTFRLPHEQSSGLKQYVINAFKGKRGYEKQNVLRDISFDIKRGEFFGIVGRNGSGKSTLLKVLASIYEVDGGEVDVKGSLTPFIELGVGFNPELTGRENVFLNGALLGFSKKDMLEMYDSIVEFAELEKFMDQKLKNYSSGMQVRLAFSIAIRAQSDILLIDEVLAVGDAAFQQKCFDYFDQVKKDHKTIIFVSHDMESVKKYCDRALYLSGGKITKIGKPKEIAKVYERDNNEQIAQNSHDSNVKALLQIDILKDDKKTKLFEYNDSATIRFRWDQTKLSDKVENIGVAIFKGDQNVYGVNTIGLDKVFESDESSLELNLNLGAGKYKIVAGLFGKTRDDAISFNSDGPEFVVNSDESDNSLDWDGITRLDAKWGK